MNHMNKQSGMGLVELMIGSLIGLLIVAGVLVMYTATVKGSADTLKAAKLNQELSSAMSIMTRDIRRAGMWREAQVDDENNPFSAVGFNNLVIEDIGTDPGACILYAYDRFEAGDPAAVPTTPDTAAPIPANDYYGFKLVGGEVYMHTGNSTATNSCTDITANWLKITDSDVITVTELRFTSLGSQCLNGTSGTAPWASDTENTFPCADNTTSGYTTTAGDVLYETRQVNITLEGELTSDSKVTKTLQQIVRVRNDRVSIAAATVAVP